MNKQLDHPIDSAPQANAPSDESAQPAPRPWVQPTFEQVDMKEALGSIVDGPGVQDGDITSS